MTKRELTKLTGCKNWQQATGAIHARFEKRVWRRNGKTYTPAGIDSKTLDFHLSLIESAGPNCAKWERIIIPMDTAIDCISGNF